MSMKHTRVYMQAAQKKRRENVARQKAEIRERRARLAAERAAKQPAQPAAQQPAQPAAARAGRALVRLAAQAPQYRHDGAQPAAANGRLLLRHARPGPTAHYAAQHAA